MVTYELIQSGTRSWDALFAEAAARASELGPARLAAISHASDASSGTILLWTRDAPAGPQRWMRYLLIRSSMRSWESLLTEASERASALAEGQLFALTHSADGGDGVVVVWYWVDHDPAGQKRLEGSVAVSAPRGGTLALGDGSEG